MADTTASPAIVPANQASWDDLQAIFGSRGDPSRCWCQRFKMAPGESWASVGAAQHAFRLRTQTQCGHPDSDTTSGLVAYLGGQPVGWCAVEPRSAYPRMLRNNRVPWEGRSEDKADSSVWAVTCFVTRAGLRRHGIAYALTREAVEFARQRSARAVEGYPMTTKDRSAGRASCRHARHVLRSRVHAGEPTEHPPSRDAHRVLDAGPFQRPFFEMPTQTLLNADGSGFSTDARSAVFRAGYVAESDGRTADRRHDQTHPYNSHTEQVTEGVAAMRKLLIILAVVGVGVPLLAVGPSGAATRHQVATKSLTVVMHDPGCHWFYLGGGPNHRKYSLTATRSGPLTLVNFDEATLKVVGSFGTRRIAVGKKIVLSRGSYRITMVGQASDDNTLRLTVA